MIVFNFTNVYFGMIGLWNYEYYVTFYLHCIVRFRLYKIWIKYCSIRFSLIIVCYWLSRIKFRCLVSLIVVGWLNLSASVHSALVSPLSFVPSLQANCWTMAVWTFQRLALGSALDSKYIVRLYRIFVRDRSVTGLERSPCACEFTFSRKCNLVVILFFFSLSHSVKRPRLERYESQWA